jgi:hypothetical protein
MGDRKQHGLITDAKQQLKEVEGAAFESPFCFERGVVNVGFVGRSFEFVA